jgi:hypothetical protein
LVKTLGCGPRDRRFEPDYSPQTLDNVMKTLKDKKCRVEFVSYTGRYPNLCAGVLTLRVDGKEIVFPSHSLSSGGSTYFTNDYADSHIEEGEWSVEFPDDFPDELMAEATQVVNDNVRLGCCGGCL